MLGQAIGNYKVTAVIGEGGMGTVYRAVHEALGSSIAVKVLLPEISSNRDMVERFFNEARSAASIKHIGIVDTYDFGYLPDGRAYILMEMLEGETLAARLRRGRVHPVHALQLVRSVARALHAAHERGIVHRDIKPDNIFLVPDPDTPTGERVKLVDFGIAKLSGGTELGLTRTGTVMGTPMYMSPEQCRGAGAIDRRADLYALGCILYKLLCGRAPFVAEGAGDIIARHLYFQPDPPRLLDPSIPPSVEALILALLQKDPAHRPPTALVLVEQIDRLAGPATSASLLPGAVSAPTPESSSVTTLGGATTSSTIARPAPGWQTKLMVGGSIAGVLAAVVAVVVVSSRLDRQRHAASWTPAGAAPPSSLDAAVMTMAATEAAPSMANSGLPDAGLPDAGLPDAAVPDATRRNATRRGSARAAAARRDAARADAALSARPEAAASPVVADHAASVSSSSRREHSPARPADSAPSTSASPPAPHPASSEVSSTCSKRSFASVLQAKQPDETVVQAALTRLRKCQKELAPDVYIEIQQQLVSKL